jgi:hypothetical protein
VPVKCMSISSPVKCMSVSSHLCQWSVYVNFFSHVPVKCMSVSSHLYHWSVCQVLSICANDVYISSSHLCQWSVCQFLLTCASEVYVSVFPPVPLKCMSGSFHLCQWRVYQFFPPVPMKCMSISSHMCQWSVWYNTKGFLQPIPLLCMIFKFCQWCGRAGFSFKSFFHMFLTLKFQYCLYLVFFMGCLCLILKLFLEKGYKAMQKISTWYELYCIHAII